MTSASPKGKQSPAKAGLTGKTLPKAIPQQSISHNDSYESVGTSVAAASGAQLPLQQTNAHSMINCKHLPNRQTFLRLYYDVIRNIANLSSVFCRSNIFMFLIYGRMPRYARFVDRVDRRYLPVSNVFNFRAAIKAPITTAITTTKPAMPYPWNAQLVS